MKLLLVEIYAVAQQRAAEALDQIARAARDLIGAVDRNIDAAMLGEARERYAEAPRQGRRRLGGRDPYVRSDLRKLAHILPLRPRAAMWGRILA
jgi:hypothetical protein